MRELALHIETGKVVTQDEFNIVARMVGFLVKLDVLEKQSAFDIIMKSFDHIFV